MFCQGTTSVLPWIMHSHCGDRSNDAPDRLTAVNGHRKLRGFYAKYASDGPKYSTVGLYTFVACWLADGSLFTYFSLTARNEHLHLHA